MLIQTHPELEPRTLTNGDVLNQQVFELTMYNKLPLKLCISNRVIYLENSKDDYEEVICIDANTGEVIAIKGIDVLTWRGDKEWLDAEYEL